MIAEIKPTPAITKNTYLVRREGLKKNRLDITRKFMIDYCRINSLISIAFLGKDAATFLQGQLSTDVQALPTNHWQRFAYCSRQGRMLANGIIARHPAANGDEQFLLLICADIADSFMQNIKKYILRSKVTLQGQHRTIHGSLAPNPSPPANSGTVEKTDDAIILHDNNQTLTLSNSTDNTPPAADSTADNLKESQWWHNEIQRGVMWVCQGAVDEHIPQHVNFDLIGGVDFSKGCYVGQEVIARLQYLGDIKKRAFIIEGQPPLTSFTVGDKIHNAAGKAVGSIVNTALNQHNQPTAQPTALACLAVSATADALTVADHPLTLKHPPYPFPHREKARREM